MDVRFAQPQLEAIALRLGPSDRLPAEVIRALQMVVFWLGQAVEDMDISAFSASTDEGGITSFDICGNYCLEYDFTDGVITFLDLWCK